MDVFEQAIGAARSLLPGIMCRLHEPMKDHTSFRVGGTVRAMLFPCSEGDMVALLGLLDEYGVLSLVVGNGTNLLVADGALDVLVISTKELRNVCRTGDAEITADAGVSLRELAEFAFECSLSGLEFAHGIPGSLGGAVFMNAGAYASQMKDVVYATTAYRRDMGICTVVGEEHGFSYRHSRFADTGEIVLSSVLRLVQDDKLSIRERMEGFAERRRASQPLDLPSAGSTFKRPKDGYAAALIEDAGLKGFAIGGAQVSIKHSGFGVNRGDATFSDVMAVIGHVKEAVLKQFGIELEPEVRIVRG